MGPFARKLDRAILSIGTNRNNYNKRILYRLDGTSQTKCIPTNGTFLKSLWAIWEICPKRICRISTRTWSVLRIRRRHCKESSNNSPHHSSHYHKKRIDIGNTIPIPPPITQLIEIRNHTHSNCSRFHNVVFHDLREFLAVTNINVTWYTYYGTKFII